MTNMTANPQKSLETQLISIVSELPSIDFEIEGVKISLSPQAAQRNWADYSVSTELYLYLSDFYGPLPTFGLDTTKSQRKRVEKVTSKTLPSVLERMWKQYKEEIIDRQIVVEYTTWCQGRDVYQDIKKVTKNPAVKLTVSWKQLCEFSRNFTNRIETANPNLVYMDNSGAFKERGAYRNSLEMSSFSKDRIVLSHWYLEYSEAVENDFGNWLGYEFSKNSIFFFSSCNGNTLVAITGTSKKAVEIYVSTENCNYAKFWEKG